MLRLNILMMTMLILVGTVNAGEVVTPGDSVSEYPIISPSPFAATDNVSYSNSTNYWGDYFYTLFDDYTDWNTAFGWGDHSLAGYLTSQLWTNVSGIATYDGNVNVTGNLSAQRIGLYGTQTVDHPLSFHGLLGTGDPNTIIHVDLNTSQSTAFPLHFRAYTVVESGAGGEQILKGEYGSYNNGSASVVATGVYLESDTNSVGMIEPGTRATTGVEAQMGNGQGAFNSDGIWSRYGFRGFFNGLISVAGTPEFEDYGLHLVHNGNLNVGGTTNKYGIYLDGWARNPVTELNGDGYSIFVNNGQSYFGGDIIANGTTTFNGEVIGINHTFDYQDGPTHTGVIYNSEENHTANPNNLIFGIYGNGSTGQQMPHFWIQNGGASQASGVSRSFMIVNEAIALQNSTNITSCPGYMDYVGEELKIDCNTTTTGADLLVGDDAQFVDEVWTKDQEGEWHKTSRDNSILDELVDDIVLSRYDCEVYASGGTPYLNVTQRDIVTENLVNLGLNTSEFVISNPYELTAGTFNVPQDNYVVVNENNIIEVHTENPGSGHANICNALLGNSSGDVVRTFTVEDEHPVPYELTKHLYNRLWVEGAKYSTGVAQTIDASTIAFDNGTVYSAVTSTFYEKKNVSQSTKLVWVNDPDGAYSEHTDFSGVAKYADGAAILANKYVNIVMWGTAEGQDDYIYFNVEDDTSGSAYTSANDCYADSDDRSVYGFPSEFSTTGFLVARTCFHNTGSDEMQQTSTGTYFLDLRGLPPLQAVAGSSGAGSLSLQEVMNNGATTTVNYTGTNVLPTTDSLYTLGTNLVRWLTGYFDTVYATTVNATTLTTGNMTITENSTTVIMDTGGKDFCWGAC